MSPRNWAECPRCKVLKARFEGEIDRRVKEFYGKVDIDSFDALRESAGEIESPYDEFEQCLREDYSIGVTEDGDLVFHYRCHCETCGFHLEHDGEKEGPGLLPEDSAAEDAAYDAFEELDLPKMEPA